jgi:DNA-binding Lrp family transcriptional regulator
MDICAVLKGLLLIDKSTHRDLCAADLFNALHWFNRYGFSKIPSSRNLQESLGISKSTYYASLKRLVESEIILVTPLLTALPKRGRPALIYQLNQDLLFAQYSTGEMLKGMERQQKNTCIKHVVDSKDSIQVPLCINAVKIPVVILGQTRLLLCILILHSTKYGLVYECSNAYLEKSALFSSAQIKFQMENLFALGIVTKLATGLTPPKLGIKLKSIYQVNLVFLSNLATSLMYVQYEYTKDHHPSLRYHPATIVANLISSITMYKINGKMKFGYDWLSMVDKETKEQFYENFISGLKVFAALFSTESGINYFKSSLVLEATNFLRSKFLDDADNNRVSSVASRMWQCSPPVEIKEDDKSCSEAKKDPYSGFVDAHKFLAKICAKPILEAFDKKLAHLEFECADIFFVNKFFVGIESKDGSIGCNPLHYHWMFVFSSDDALNDRFFVINSSPVMYTNFSVNDDKNIIHIPLTLGYFGGVSFKKSSE